MEKYIQDNVNEDVSVIYGDYTNQIHNQQTADYGENSADRVRDSICTTFKECQLLLKNQDLKHNMLLVGKVQSGKTSNIEIFTAMAFDNGYNMIIVYGGYDDTLLGQTTRRFKKTFNVSDETTCTDNRPAMFLKSNLKGVDDSVLNAIFEKGKPVIIMCLKRPSGIKEVNNMLSRVETKNIRAFIFDDEGDQASLNTKKDKRKESSSTYKEIVNMKKKLSNPLYLSVTATPQANIFLDDISELVPERIRLIEPAEDYCGAGIYHLSNTKYIKIIKEDDLEQSKQGKLPKSLFYAINHFIVSSAIMVKRGINYSDMIIHSNKEKEKHNNLYTYIEQYLKEFNNLIQFSDEYLPVKMQELAESYKEVVGEAAFSEFTFEELQDEIKKVVQKSYVILKNGDGKDTQAFEQIHQHRIYVGGDLLQRGVTFKFLVTTYFTRWAKNIGNMDTSLQRARWFGYRANYIDLCKIFTTQEISQEFSNLADIEDDLWDQFYQVQNEEMKISELLIKKDKTNLKPTRKNVANYKKIQFRHNWIKQRYGVFDKSLLINNNKVVNDFFDSIEFQSTSNGRRDGNESARYAFVKTEHLIKLIDNLNNIFSMTPFEKNGLKKILYDQNEIPIILMPYDDDGRERSFYDNNQIYALLQGADSKYEDKKNYEGDSNVIVDQNKVNIQIHRIVPKKDMALCESKEVMHDYSQYMFAIFVPKDKEYYVRD